MSVTVPRDHIERVWSIEGLFVDPDGTARFSPELRESLIEDLAAERSDLLSEVVTWSEGIVTHDIARLDSDSPAAIEARIIRARLQFIDPDRRKEARKNLDRARLSRRRSRAAHPR